MSVKFISDLHFGHRNIHKYRNQFETSDEHDEYVFEKLIEKLNKRDKLFILGDVCFSTEKFFYMEELIKICPNIVILLGNHDLERGSSPKLTDYLELGYDVKGMMKYKSFWLSHAPIHSDELRGKLNIHGHMHSNVIDDSRYLNVSCERVNYEPITLDDVRKYFFGEKYNA